MQSQIHRALAVIQQSTRGPNAGGIMSSDLFSYSNTGEPKRIVKDFLQEVITTLPWITEQTIRVQQLQQQPMTTMTSNRRNHHTGGALSPSVYPSMAPQAAPYPSSLPSFVVSAGTMGTDPPPSTPSSTAHDTLVLNVLKWSRAAYGHTALCWFCCVVAIVSLFYCCGLIGNCCVVLLWLLWLLSLGFCCCVVVVL